MALSSCFFSSPLCSSYRINGHTRLLSSKLCDNQINQRQALSRESMNTGLFGRPVVGNDVKQCTIWNFLRRPSIFGRPQPGGNKPCRKSVVIYASWLPSSQIAASAFTWGTVAVLPFYTFMVVAPQAELTKKIVASSIPYIVLGVLYAYLLYLSWTPDTIRFMFGSKYWLPELPGIAKMFSSEMTLASAWIHLLAVDLFAARQVYLDGVEGNVETRHSVSLCLLFCPVGIMTHFITKAIASTSKEKTEHRLH